MEKHSSYKSIILIFSVNLPRVEILINPPGEPREHLVEVRHKIKYQIISVIYESIILIFLMNCPTIYKFCQK